MGEPCMSPASQEKLIHVNCCARELLYSNSMVIAGSLLSLRAQNIPFKCTRLLKRDNILSIFTFENIFCAYFCHLYIQLCICCSKIYASKALVDTAPELCQKGDIFS